MQPGFELLREGCVNRTLASNPAEPGKRLSDNPHIKMCFTFGPGPRMTRMTGAVICDFKLAWIKFLL